MGQPIQPDPHRPLQLAIRSTRLLGIVSAGFGLVIIIPFGYFNKFHTYRPHFIALGLIVWFIPGVLFLTCSSMLKQRLRRGAVGAIAVGIAQEIFALLLLAGTIFLPPVSAIPILLCVLWCAALWELLFRAFQSLPLLARDTDRTHGFDLASPQPVLTVEQAERQDPKTPGHAE